MQNYNSKLIIVILLGISIGLMIAVPLLGTGVTSFFANAESCYPIPNFILPNADATTYYFNTTNHRWYTVTSNLYVIYNASAPFGAGFWNSYDAWNFPENGYDYYSIGLLIDSGDNSGVSLIGQQVKQMNVLFAKDGATANNDIVSVGDFSLTTGYLLHNATISRNADTDFTLTSTYYNFTFDTPFTIADHTGIGMFLNQTSSIAGANAWHDYTDNDDNDDGYKLVDMVWGGLTIPQESGSGRNYQITLLGENTTYTLIPYSNEHTNHLPSGSTPANTFESASKSCGADFTILAISAVVAFCAVILLKTKVLENRGSV